MMFLAAEASIWESGLVAALIAALAVVAGYWWNTRAARLDRHRQLFAEAFGAVMEYREYPFIVRRRTSETDRSDISAGLSIVQASLNKYAALLRIESDIVGAHYQRLVAETRRLAGEAVAQGWNLPVHEIGQMHVEDVDLSALAVFDTAFVTAVKHHLDVLPLWAHREIPLPVSIPSGGLPVKNGRSTS